jgi:hypothetical protein
MYGLSDHLKGIPRTALSAVRHGSSRYSTFTLSRIEHMFVYAKVVASFSWASFRLGSGK